MKEKSKKEDKLTKKIYDGDEYLKDVFRIYLEQLIIRNACEKYYPKKAFFDTEKFTLHNAETSLYGDKTILDNFQLAKEMTVYL